MNSALYSCLVMHHRFSPAVHKFHYRHFMWWLDLDELPELARKRGLFSFNKFNLFSYYDRDHLKGESNELSTRENIAAFLKENNVEWDGGKIFLLTNLRSLGYLFNPVSFYYIYQQNGEALCSIAEVGNTYYEMKPYLITDFNSNSFDLRIKKNFYVSPFTQLDDEFDFRLQIPGEKLNIKIDDYRNGGRFFISTLTGEKQPLTNANILRSFFRFPLVTLRVIYLIHWQALKLWLKKIPFQAKAANPDLQTGVYRKHKSLKQNLS